MIDTFELYLRITKQQKLELQDAINECIESMNNFSIRKSKKMHLEQGVVKTAAFKKYGVLELKLPLVKEGLFTRYWIMMKIKPAIAIYPDDVYALSRDDDYLTYRNIFMDYIIMLNDFVSNKKNSLPIDINYWNLRRIDYAFQFMTPYYKEYIYLLKKVSRQEKRRKYTNSLYIIGKRYTINFYDKTQKYIQSYFYDIDCDEHMIRFEVQCKKEYLKNFYQNKSIESLNLKSFWNINLAKHIVIDKMIKYIKSGDYYDKNTGKEILTSMYSQGKVKKLMLLLECSIHNSTLLVNLPFLYSIINHSGLNANQVKRNLFPALSEAGINPLAIPDSWGIKTLPNPVKMITDFHVE